MFGTLAPRRCALREGARDQYDTYYCGLCKSLGDRYGLATRATLSHDAVFMALLADGLQVQGAPDASCRCPLVPIQTRKTVDSRSVAMTYAAGVQVLLGDQWLADKELEGRRGYGAARRAFASRVTRARALLAGLDMDLSALDGFEHRQATRELEDCGPARAAEPTAEALGELLARITSLPGVIPAARSHATQAALRALGRSIGRGIYLLDALEDLRDDYLSGSFNPCIARGDDGHRLSPARIDETARLLLEDLDAFRAGLRALPLARNREVLEHILCGRFAQRARAAIVAARCYQDALLASAMQRVREASRPTRALWHVALWLLAVAVTLARSVEALAQSSGRHHRHPRDFDGFDTVKDAAVGADASMTSVAQPRLVEETGAYVPVMDLPGAQLHPGTSNRGHSVCDDAANGCCHTVGCDRCAKSCCDAACQRCGCCDACKGCQPDCGKVCGDCGCGKICSDCGHCHACDGCGNCGNCCNGCNGCNSGSGCNGCCR